MLTTAELTSMQTTQALTFTETCTISRRTLSSDSAGGYTDSWSTVATTSCRLSPMSANEIIVAGQQKIVAGWKATLPVSTDVRGEDRIVVGSRSFEVTSVQKTKTRETAKVCLCQER